MTVYHHKYESVFPPYAVSRFRFVAQSFLYYTESLSVDNKRLSSLSFTSYSISQRPLERSYLWDNMTITM